MGRKNACLHGLLQDHIRHKGLRQPGRQMRVCGSTEDQCCSVPLRSLALGEITRWIVRSVYGKPTRKTTEVNRLSLASVVSVLGTTWALKQDLWRDSFSDNG